jgi:hypothetical protein
MRGFLPQLCMSETEITARMPGRGSKRFHTARGFLMRKLVGVLAIGVFVVTGQASAAPATLSSATFAFAISGLPAATFVGVGATGTATSNLGASLDAGTAFNGGFTTAIPTSAAPPLTHIQVIVTQNDGNTFTGTAPSNVGGDLMFQGAANVFGIGSFPTGPPLLNIPLQIGSPNTVYKGGSLVSITAIASGWTAGTANVTGVDDETTTTTASNATVVHHIKVTRTSMGSNALTPGGAGTLVLVTPVKIITTAAGTLASFGVLTLNYVPEPGGLVLSGAAIAGLIALARRRS